MSWKNWRGDSGRVRVLPRSQRLLQPPPFALFHQRRVPLRLLSCPSSSSQHPDRPAAPWSAMTANGLAAGKYACKCLNVRIHAQPTTHTPPPAEAGFTPVYAGEEGIRVVRRALLLRTSRSLILPILGPHRGHPQEPQQTRPGPRVILRRPDSIYDSDLPRLRHPRISRSTAHNPRSRQRGRAHFAHRRLGGERVAQELLRLG